jgi:hypothetical protein
MRTDPAAAITALSDVPHFPGLDSMRHTRINQLAAVDVEAALQLVKKWKTTGFSHHSPGVAAWVAKDPQHAAKVVAELGVAPQMMEIIGEIWAERDPAAALRFRLRPWRRRTASRCKLRS